MSMSALINGADCGPVNPLQGLSKQLDRDRGIQQDHFGSSNSRAGPSRLGFRTVPFETPQSSRFAQEASQFFSNAQSPSALPHARPFTPPAFATTIAGPSPAKNMLHSAGLSQDTWRMSSSSTSAAAPLRAQQGPSVAPIVAADWAADFSISNVSTTSGTPASTMKTPYSTTISQSHTPMSMGLGASQYMHQPVWNMQPPSASTASEQQVSVAPDWAAHFESVEKEALNATTAEHEPVVEPSASTSSITVDDLSATAALLIQSVQHETNPKFQNSEFMSLMRRLRDRQAIVDGNNIVENDASSIMGASTSAPAQRSASAWQEDFLSGSTSLSSALGKGKSRATDAVPGSSSSSWGPLPSTTSYNVAPGFYDTIAAQEGDPLLYSKVLEQEMKGATASASISAALEQDSLTDYFEHLGLDEEQDGEQEPLGKDYLLNNDAMNGAERYAELGRMQAEWDALDAAIETDAATRSASARSSGYQFHERNPYMEAEQQRSQYTSVNHSALPYQSVLQTEAAVQHDPTNASAWFTLGVRQQENEQEDKAIQALNRAVQLDPKHSAALLALAVSHTNENDRAGALDAIGRWVDVYAETNEMYREALRAHRALNHSLEGGAFLDKQRDFVECLMTMARATPDGQIDADIQIALGVLLNASEEYDKARDCFQTALAVRPDDPQLYNRVGATLANSGRAEEALDYYYRALELNPSYIRARFNLGISCINLKLYAEAAHHILDALVLQDIDSSSEGNGSGISSSSLWNSLRTTCMHMQRHDLVTLCERKDLASFREAFEASS